MIKVFISTNIRSSNCKKCVFCKYWYDPLNQYIRPKYPNNGVWEYDNDASAKCLQSNLVRKSYGHCNRLVCKIEL